MANAWPIVKLGDVIDLFDSRRVPLNSRQRQERQGQYPYYGAQGIIDHIDDYIFDGRYILVAEDGENLNSKKLPLALLARGKFWVNNHAHILRGKVSIADDTFLLACLNNADIKPFVTGAAQPKLSQANLRLIEIPFPPLPIQKRVAGILSAYDELIENSQRRIKILETMARALYREWFVHFRFPGHENTRIVDGLPEAWTRRPLEEIAECRLGKMLDQDKNRGDMLPYLANLNVRWGEFDLSDLREMRFEQDEIETFGLRFGDIVMCEGGEPGRCAIWKEQLPGIMIQKAIHRIRCRENMDHNYLYQSLRHLGQSGYLATLFTGSTIKHLPREKLAKVAIVVPPEPLLSAFRDTMISLEEQIHTLQRQIQNLRRTRDLLLPRLLSGQIDVEALPA